MILANVTLNEVFNKILDIAEEEDVKIEVEGGGKLKLVKTVEEGLVSLSQDDVIRLTKTSDDSPPTEWHEFISRATELFVQKNTDYGNRYTKALIEEGPVIWRWEIDKKIDRIRSWIKRGELLVKGEGVTNSVQDLFNYTILYILYNKAVQNNIDPYVLLTENDFYSITQLFTAERFVDYLENKGRISPEEIEVKALILKYMGAGNEK